eukprot:Skav222810  [mRNA]  locus=scaffold1444:69145:70680:+ [translate_table: standard]
MPEARGVDFEILSVTSEGNAAALAAVGEAEFLVYFPKVGFKYLDLVEQRFTSAMNFTGSISPGHGIFAHKQGNSTCISFVEAPPKSFATYLPSGEVAGRTSSKEGAIIAVCNAGHSLVAVMCSSAHVRFVDIATGKAAGKWAKLPDVPRGESHASFCMSQLQARQVVCMKQIRPGANPHFWIIELDELNNTVAGPRRSLKLGSVARDLGGFNELQSISGSSVKGEVILCWKKPTLTNGFLNGKTHTAPPEAKKFSAAKLLGGEEVRRLGAFIDGTAVQAFHGIGSYLAEFWSEPEGDTSGTLRFRLRDSKFGIFVAAGEVSLEGTQLLAAASQRFSLICANGNFVGIRWTAPMYSLQRSVGQGATASGSQNPRKRKHEEENEVSEISATWISQLVQLCQGPHKKNVSDLKRKLKPEHLPFILRTLVTWLSFRRDLSAPSIHSTAPGIPTTQQIVRFLSVLADGFLQSVVQLPSDDIQKAGLVTGDGGIDGGRTSASWKFMESNSGIDGRAY